MELKFNKIIPAIAVTVALAIGAAACNSPQSDNNPNGYDPNIDQEVPAPAVISLN